MPTMRATAAALRVGRYRHEDQHGEQSTDAEQLREFHIIQFEQLLCQWRLQILPRKLPYDIDRG
jgi:hypothetical protein